MNATVPAREMLDSFWTFADNLKPIHKWGMIASASGLDTVLTSFIYYVRYNDALTFTIDASHWRHMNNLREGRVFSFLIANTEVFDVEPLKYVRLFLQGIIAAYPLGSPESERIHFAYKQNNPIDPKQADHVCVLKPTAIAYGIKTMPAYCPEEMPLKLEDCNFDSDYRYVGG